MSKRAIQSSTIRPHSQGLEELRQSHTSRASSEIFAPEFTQPEPATLANPTIASRNTSHNAKGMRSDDHDTTDTNDVRIVAQVAKKMRRTKMQKMWEGVCTSTVERISCQQSA